MTKTGISRRDFCKNISLGFLAAGLGSLPGCSQTKNTKSGPATKPNIIFVLADDLGYGDLICYGQKTLNTTHLDRMAREGMKFTQHYAGSTVCAPSRCVLMTGMHTGHCTVRGNHRILLKNTDVTIADILKQAGYTTGCIGKWGIGHPPPADNPNKHGFDYFWGYVNMFHAHNCFPEFVICNGKEVKLRNKLAPKWQNLPPDKRGGGVAVEKVDFVPELMTRQALDFIRRNQDRPFFLYLALNIPHANNEGGKKGMEVPEYADFVKSDWPQPEKGFATMIRDIDRDMGKVFQLLKDLNLDDNTIVIFTSDNGPHQEGGHIAEYFDSNGDLRGIKRDLYEGGVREPLIVRWPGKIKPGITSAHVSGFQDFLSTLAEISGVDHSQVDGISMLPTLLGQPEKQKQHPYLYWEFLEQGGKQAVLLDKFKGIRLNTKKNPNAPIELYDITQDIRERTNIADRHPDITSRIAKIMKQAHTPPDA